MDLQTHVARDWLEPYLSTSAQPPLRRGDIVFSAFSTSSSHSSHIDISLSAIAVLLHIRTMKAPLVCNLSAFRIQTPPARTSHTTHLFTIDLRNVVLITTFTVNMTLFDSVIIPQLGKGKTTVVDLTPVIITDEAVGVLPISKQAKLQSRRRPTFADNNDRVVTTLPRISRSRVRRQPTKLGPFTQASPFAQVSRLPIAPNDALRLPLDFNLQRFRPLDMLMASQIVRYTLWKLDVFRNNLFNEVLAINNPDNCVMENKFELFINYKGRFGLSDSAVEWIRKFLGWCTSDTAIVFVSLRHNDGGHANMLTFQRQTKTFDLYDPRGAFKDILKIPPEAVPANILELTHGSTNFTDVIHIILTKLGEELGFQYEPGGSALIFKGLQSLHSECRGDVLGLGGKGLCILWTMFMALARTRFPDLPVNVIHDSVARWMKEDNTHAVVFAPLFVAELLAATKSDSIIIELINEIEKNEH